jgi:hypothetical protein
MQNSAHRALKAALFWYNFSHKQSVSCNLFINLQNGKTRLMDIFTTITSLFSGERVSHTDTFILAILAEGALYWHPVAQQTP